MSFTATPKMGQGTKLLIELGPLVCFFIANWKAGIYWGTGIFMVATVIAISVSAVVGAVLMDTSWTGRASAVTPARRHDPDESCRRG